MVIGAPVFAQNKDAKKPAGEKKEAAKPKEKKEDKRISWPAGAAVPQCTARPFPRDGRGRRVTFLGGVCALSCAIPASVDDGRMAGSPLAP